MNSIDTDRIDAADIFLSCSDLTETLDFYTESLGFRIEMIYPADSPRIAVVSGYGIRVRLDRNIDSAPADLSLELAPLEPSLVVRQLVSDDDWGAGRAGMQYRDLIPGRLGGRYIASHIRIPDGGPVPDYVHHHHILFQLIYCYKGWVRVVYEDQGPPFVMKAGDCVLQPPHIRHRVLECSDGFEVVEIGCPAEHATLIDHDLELPTVDLKSDRDFGGQAFHFHQSAEADWLPWRIDGFEMRDTGIGAATRSLVSVVAVRPVGEQGTAVINQDTELLFGFVLVGSMSLESDGEERWNLAAGDSFTIPAELNSALSNFSNDLEFLEVVSPAPKP